MKQNYIVCLDPGHGPGTVNGSPDGTYKERDFAWDMYLRLRSALEGPGITVVGTREEDQKPSLTARADVSNHAGADLFVSLHSNAAGGSGWSSAHGLLIYTSAPGESAERNKLARAVLRKMQAMGIELQGDGLAHNGYTVLTKTKAPAILIEYGFHTNKEDVARLKDPYYRGELAIATAKGICAYLGVAWTLGGGGQLPWYAEAQQWAKDLGIADGTRPEAPCTRAEAWVMLKRYHDGEKGGK